MFKISLDFFTWFRTFQNSGTLIDIWIFKNRQKLLPFSLYCVYGIFHFKFIWKSSFSQKKSSKCTWRRYLYKISIIFRIILAFIVNNIRIKDTRNISFIGYQYYKSVKNTTFKSQFNLLVKYKKKSLFAKTVNNFQTELLNIHNNVDEQHTLFQYIIIKY